MAAAAPADVLAREMVAKICDNLITRSTWFPTFDETRGSVDYTRWRRDLLSCVQSAGVGFRESLLFAGSVPEAPTMTDADIMLDTAAGHAQLTMPQMRQQALLIVIRATLNPSGESIKLVRSCVHAGGVVQRAGVNHDQALRILDRRWLAADVTALSASVNEQDVILEKGLLDALVCRADAAQAVRSALREVWQGLSSDGLFVVITPKFELLEGFFAHCSNIWVLDSVKKLGCGGSGSAAVGQGAAPRQGVSAKTPAAAMMTFRAVGKPPRRAQPPSRPVYA